MSYRKVKDIMECEDCEKGLVSAAERCSSARRFREENEHEYRTPFARDRDRIIYSVSFQRLVSKTQLFPEADPSRYTTRLLHSIKVAQIAQTIARSLKLNEDLAVAIALGHDLGHAPFGHIGEDVIRELLIDENGFEHNEESVFTAMYYEPMNLTIQTLDGMLKHTRFSFKVYEEAQVKRRNPFEKIRMKVNGMGKFEDPFEYWGGRGEDGKIIFKRPSSYEGQIVDIADEIAYISHDVVDLTSADVISTDDLPEQWLEYFMNDVGIAIGEFVNGIISENSEEIERATGEGRVCEIKHPEELNYIVDVMKKWFNENIYQADRVKEEGDPRNILIKLFEYFLKNPANAIGSSPFGKDIASRGYKGKRLAGHILASLTDGEARSIYTKI